MRYASLLLLILIAMLTPALEGAAQSPAPSTPPVVRVVTGQAAPFVFATGSRTSGFSIDLWNALAQRLGINFSMMVLAPQSQKEQLKVVQRGEADVAISAITMTAEAERDVDFSTSYFDSGLQIVVPVRNETPALAIVEALLSPAIGLILIVAFAIFFLLANILWLVERPRNPLFQRGYFRGIADGLWGVLLIIATGEYGDRDTTNGIKRLTVAFMWLLGVVLVAQFTATITAALTVQELTSTIRGPDDLPGKTVGTVPGSVAADYLRQQGITYVDLPSIDGAIDMLVGGRVQAIVFDAPTLQYWAAKRGQGVFRLVGPVFRPQKYGIAVSLGSPLRKQINEALEDMFLDGSYEDLYRKWFSQGK
jgi:polar amino acid transport system substrate-binding protein